MLNDPIHAHDICIVGDDCRVSIDRQPGTLALPQDIMQNSSKLKSGVFVEMFYMFYLLIESAGSIPAALCKLRLKHLEHKLMSA